MRHLALAATALMACTPQVGTRTSTAAPASASRSDGFALEIKEGDPAPAFSGTGDDGKTYALADMRGKYVVIYFYPKDDTPGCTVEAQGFTADQAKYDEKNAEVLGVSLDDAESHKAFRAKHGLTFPLLTNGEEVARAFGVPVRLTFAARQTFVIDREGRVKKIFRSVNPDGHSAEVLKLLD